MSRYGDVAADGALWLVLVPFQIISRVLVLPFWIVGTLARWCGWQGDQS